MIRNHYSAMQKQNPSLILKHHIILYIHACTGNYLTFMGLYHIKRFSVKLIEIYFMEKFFCEFILHQNFPGLQ